MKTQDEIEPGLSLCYLYLPEETDSEKAWKSLLWRSPRTLEWSDINGIASEKRLLGFDFSQKVLSRRENQIVHGNQYRFVIKSEETGLDFKLGNNEHFLETPFESPIFIHLVLKMILNTHSTLIMGRLGRYEGNVMTYVRASNNKLIDRSIRYIDLILQRKNIKLTYDKICYKLYEMLEKTHGDKSIVLTTVRAIEKQS